MNPTSLTALYEKHLIIHTSPTDAFWMCFGSSVAHLSFINQANRIFQRDKQEFEEEYQRYCIEQSSIRTSPKNSKKVGLWQEPEKEKHMAWDEETDDADNQFITASEAAYGRRQASPHIKSPVSAGKDIPAAGYHYSPKKEQERRSIRSHPPKESGLWWMEDSENQPEDEERECSAPQMEENEQKISQLYPKPSIKWPTNAARKASSPSKKKFSSEQPQIYEREDERNELEKEEADELALKEENDMKIAQERERRKEKARRAKEQEKIKEHGQSSVISSSKSSSEELPVTIANPLYLDIAANRSLFAGPTASTNWVIPGLLLMGAFPEYDVKALLDSGVEVFVNLMMGDEIKEKRKRMDAYFESAVRLVREDEMAVLKAEMQREKMIQAENDRRHMLPSPSATTSSLAFKHPATEGKGFARSARDSRANRPSTASSVSSTSTLASSSSTASLTRMTPLLKQYISRRPGTAYSSISQSPSHSPSPSISSSSSPSPSPLPSNSPDLGPSLRNSPSKAAETQIPPRKFQQSLDRMQYLEFPIRDGCTAHDRDTAALVEYLTYCIAELGQCVFVHSLEGHGRPAVICSLILARLFGSTSTRVITAMQEFHNCRKFTPEFPSPASHEQRMQIYRIVNLWNGQTGGSSTQTQTTSSSSFGTPHRPSSSQSQQSPSSLSPLSSRASSSGTSILPETLERVNQWIIHTGTSVLLAMLGAARRSLTSSNSLLSSSQSSLGSTTPSQSCSLSSSKNSFQSKPSSVSAVSAKDFPAGPHAIYPARKRPVTASSDSRRMM
eukprot:MONOS_4240.1-p1 / transcript=MONOS_4240.1 / gene=MONOS_4240 / organism=Monocercomonoides_exilis_PA203 / gene_product=unspecified product / transcript_product=unspecified product / location=Mono_scaffold00110:71867-74504(-) / protein_length=788 / sequence_SO=supercontig / SO=protein_coding / is_pseudo=false